jgi:hypothetical protein
MHVFLSIAVWLFGAIVLLGGSGFVILDAMDKVESIKTRAPWITKILERRSALVALLMICTVLLIGNRCSRFLPHKLGAQIPVWAARIERIEDQIAAFWVVELAHKIHGRVVNEGALPALLDLA